MFYIDALELETYLESLGDRTSDSNAQLIDAQDLNGVEDISDILQLEVDVEEFIEDLGNYQLDQLLQG